MKTLKTNLYNIDRIYFGLDNIRPSEFKTIAEIEQASRILEILRDDAKIHIALINQGEVISEKYQGVTNDDKEFKDYSNEIISLNGKIKSQESKDRLKNIVIEFENEEFNQLFQFFEKWGKNWFMKIDEFLLCRRDLNKTNSEPNKK